MFERLTHPVDKEVEAMLNRPDYKAIMKAKKLPSLKKPKLKV